MCGRISLSTPTRVLAEIFGVSIPFDLQQRYNLAPTQRTLIIRGGGDAVREAAMARWGFIPPWRRDGEQGPEPINARSESAAATLKHSPSWLYTCLSALHWRVIMSGESPKTSSFVRFSRRRLILAFALFLAGGAVGCQSDPKPELATEQEEQIQRRHLSSSLNAKAAEKPQAQNDRQSGEGSEGEGVASGDADGEGKEAGESENATNEQTSADERSESPASQRSHGEETAEQRESSTRRTSQRAEQEARQRSQTDERDRVGETNEADAQERSSSTATHAQQNPVAPNDSTPVESGSQDAPSNPELRAENETTGKGGSEAAPSSSSSDLPDSAWRSNLPEGGEEAVGALVFPREPDRAGLDAADVEELRLPETDTTQPLIGAWRQSAGGDAADFAPGGYSDSILIFRRAGQLDVIRYFGPDRNMQLDSRFRYSTEKDKRVDIKPGADADDQQGRLADGAVTIPLGTNGERVTIQPRASDPPLTVPYELEDETLKLDGKTYQRLEQSTDQD